MYYNALVENNISYCKLYNLFIQNQMNCTPNKVVVNGLNPDHTNLILTNNKKKEKQY